MSSLFFPGCWGAVAGMTESQRAALAGQVRAELHPYADGDGVAVPDETNLVIART